MIKHLQDNDIKVECNESRNDLEELGKLITYKNNNIYLKENITKDMLIEKYRGYLSLELLLAFANKECINKLKRKNDIMTNGDRIRNLPVEELAKLLIKSITIYDYNDEFNGYETSDGANFYEDYESALEHEIEWLNSEVELTTKERLQRDCPATCNTTKLDCCYCNPCCSHRVDKE